MTKQRDERSELVVAAEALDRELARFADLARQIEKEPLGNQKSLDRMVGLFKQIGEVEAGLRGSMEELQKALGAAQRTQQSQVEAVNTRATELEARLVTFRELHARFEALGQVALHVNESLVALGGKKLAETGDPSAVAAALPDLVGSLTRATDAAKDLVTAAEEKNFPDLARSTETLRQQILAAQNRLNLLQKKLGGSSN